MFTHKRIQLNFLVARYVTATSPLSAGILILLRHQWHLRSVLMHVVAVAREHISNYINEAERFQTLRGHANV